MTIIIYIIKNSTKFEGEAAPQAYRPFYMYRKEKVNVVRPDILLFTVL